MTVISRSEATICGLKLLNASGTCTDLVLREILAIRKNCHRLNCKIKIKIKITLCFHVIDAHITPASFAGKGNHLIAKSTIEAPLIMCVNGNFVKPKQRTEGRARCVMLLWYCVS